MLLPGYSYSTIVKWARDNFPDDYKRLPMAKIVTDQLHKVPGCNKDLLRGLVIGATRDDQNNRADVLAWLDGSSMIVGYISTVAGCIQFVQYDWLSSVEGVKHFKQSFCWVCESEDKEAFGRLEALVRFYFLRKGFASAVKDNHQNFASNFRTACRLVACKGEEDEASYEQDASVSRDHAADRSLQFREVIEELDNTPPDTYEAEQMLTLADEPTEFPQTNTSTARQEPRFEHRPNSKTDHSRTTTAAPGVGVTADNALETEIRGLRLKLQGTENLRLRAERRARFVEIEAALWKGSYEQLRSRMDGTTES